MAPGISSAPHAADNSSGSANFGSAAACGDGRTGARSFQVGTGRTEPTPDAGYTTAGLLPLSKLSISLRSGESIYEGLGRSGASDGQPHVNLCLEALRRGNGHGLGAERTKSTPLIQTDCWCIAFCDCERDEPNCGTCSCQRNRSVNKRSTCAEPTARLMNEHTDEVRLVPGLGLGRELEGDCTYKAAVVERTKRRAQTRGIRDTPQPPGLWFGRAFFWRRGEGIRGGCIGVEHQLAVARCIRSAQSYDVHMDCGLNV